MLGYLRSTARKMTRRVWRSYLATTSQSSHRQGQQDSAFYDGTFEEDEYWRRHYTAVEHYCCWSVLIDRLRRRRARHLLEIGCGTGQLAAAVRDAEILTDYLGFDFSERRINQARIACTGWHFETTDAFKTELFDAFKYDSVLSTEFLEHVEDDLGVLRRIRSGAYFIGTVPNYPYVSHVRHFQNEKEVVDRYEEVLEHVEVIRLPLNPHGKMLFVVEGLRRTS